MPSHGFQVDHPPHPQDFSSPPPRRHRSQSTQSRSRRHTPSVQLALADPTLSKSLSSSPAPSRTGSEHDQQAHAKHTFKRNVRRYYYQLTVGCQLSNCANRLCRSSKSSPKMTKDAAAILAIQLAARPRLFFCNNCPMDPIINMPDSPLPLVATHSDPPATTQKKRGLSPMIPAKTATPTSSTRSSPGPAASMEDFGRHKDHRLYDPNEYSKSVPSFSVSHILSPVKSNAKTGELNRDEKTTTARSAPTHTERGGTPLIRSLLSVTPFSKMFSPGASPSSSHRSMNKSQDFPQKHSPTPSRQVKKSLSIGDITNGAERSRMHLAYSSTETGTGIFTAGLQPPPRPRSFSPVRLSSASSSTSDMSNETTGTLRSHPLFRKDDTRPFGGVTTLLGEDSVGLGYSSRRMQAQRVLDLSRYYHTPSRTIVSTSGSARKQRRKKKDSGSASSSPILIPVFGSSRDPDSDSLHSTSSIEDDLHLPKAQEQAWTEATVTDTSRHQQHFLSTVSPPQSPSERELENRTLYSFARTSFRRDSASSASSDGEGVTYRQWTPDAKLGDRAAYGGISSSSSRRSSFTETDDAEVVLPYLNLTLLRQAIATYNTSKSDDSIQLPPILNYRDFKSYGPIAETPPNELGDEHDVVEPGGHRSSVQIGLTEGFLKPLAMLDTKLDLIPSMDQPLSVPKTESELLEALGSSFGLDDGRIERYSLGMDDLDQVRRNFREDLSVSSNSESEERYGSFSSFGSPAHSTKPSSACSAEGDSTFLLDSLRSVFSSATALGSSFLMKDRERSDQEDESAPKGINIGGIDLETLRECYEMMMELKPRTIFVIQVTSSIELLLARLELEQEHSAGRKLWSEEEMRAIVILLMNPVLFDQPYQESLLRRIIQLFTAIPDTATLIQWLSCLDEEGMAQLVTLFKMYLSAHFTPRPTGAKHPAISAVKALSILYEANNISTRPEQERQSPLVNKDRDGKQHIPLETSSTISFKFFYSGVMEALKFKDEYQIWREGWGKSESEKMFSYFDYPFLLSPTSKAHILNLDGLTQMSAHYEDACVRHALADHAQRLLPETSTGSASEFQKGIRAGSSPYLVLELRRAHLVEDAFNQITKKHADLKKPLKVAFVDVGEEGVDQGGVTKEFFQLMLENIFDSQFGLFKELEEGRCWWFEGMLDGSSHVEMSAKDIRIRLVEYELVGILVGLALYNGVILGVRFPSVVYRKLLGWGVNLDSFMESFPSLGRGLEQMLTWIDGDVYDVFMREFEISYEHLGQITTLPLVPGGEHISVTNENREEYVHAYINHYVHEHIRQEFTAFQRGFEKICSGEAIKLLRPEELELLLCGNSDLDMHGLEESCLYDDGYDPEHTLIREFWEIVHDDLTPEQHKQLLVFVTGSDRVPIRGLKDLVFVIQRNGPDSERLPTALTCFSRLLMPEYASKEKMRERLVTAIENSNGFGLV